MKNQKGITLVALVITIIVLLILAGVSISLVIGNNGVLTQASNAVVTNSRAAAKQDIKMAVASCYTDYRTAWASDQSVEFSTYKTVGHLQPYLTGTVTPVKANGEEPGTGESAVAFKYVYGSSTADIIYFQVDDNGAVTFNDEVTTPFVSTGT